MLEWDPISLATAALRSLTLYRNNGKAGAIPNPTTHTSTKISGLAVDTEYAFHLVLRTSAGTYSSERILVRTHKMTDLSGITVCPGVMPSETREELEVILQRIGAKPLQDFVRIDTTHFVCTEGRGQGWERAQEMNIPVVRPEWLLACEKEGRIVGVRQFYLSADISKMRQGLPMRERAHTGASQAAPQGHRSTQSVSERRQGSPEVERRDISPMTRRESPAKVVEQKVVEEEEEERSTTPFPSSKGERVEKPEVEKLGNGTNASTPSTSVGDIAAEKSTAPEATAKIEEGFDDVQL